MTIFLLSVLLAAAPSSVTSPVPVIFDTDIMGDVDDVGAVAVLHALTDRGEAKILATGVCVKNPWSRSASTHSTPTSVVPRFLWAS